MSEQNEAIHLCPVCHVVEMRFVERIERKKFASRMRRFKCPVCDHTEMYTCGGPDDLSRQQDARDEAKMQKDTNYARRKNLFGRETFNEDYL